MNPHSYVKGAKGPAGINQEPGKEDTTRYGFEPSGLKLHKILPEAQVMVTDDPGVSDLTYFMSYYQIKFIWTATLPAHLLEIALAKLLGSEPIYVDYTAQQIYTQDHPPISASKEIMKDIRKQIDEKFENYDPEDPDRGFENIDGQAIIVMD